MKPTFPVAGNKIPGTGPILRGVTLVYPAGGKIPGTDPVPSQELLRLWSLLLA